MSYLMLKRLAGLFFNILNLLLGRNLPPVGCVCVVVEKDKRFLVIETPAGNITFPGGFMNWHETPTQTAMREVKEETGLQLTETTIIAYYPATSRRLDTMSTLCTVYHAQVAEGDLLASSEGQPLWLEEEELTEKLMPYYHPILETYRNYCAKRYKTGSNSG